MLALQSAQGQPDTAGGPHVPDPDAVPAHGAPPASQRPVVPAELPARQLARLSLLGQRAGAVGGGLISVALSTFVKLGQCVVAGPVPAPRFGSTEQAQSRWPGQARPYPGPLTGTHCQQRQCWRSSFFLVKSCSGPLAQR